MDTDTLATEETTEAPERALNVQDRCDRCKAQAFVAAQLMGEDEAELEILLCGHHGRFHTPALVEQGWVVLDFTDNINAKPTDYND